MRATITLGIAVLLLGGLPALAQDADVLAVDAKILEDANLKADADSLLDFLRKRTLTDEEQVRIEKLIMQLGSPVYRQRESAAAELIARGPVIAELLKNGLKNADLEVARRAENCLLRIKEGDYPIDVPAAVVRLVAERKPVNASKALLDYLPFADNDLVADEIRTSLTKLAVVEKKADPVLVDALTDKLAVRRAAAGEAFARARVAEHVDQVKKLLHDPDPMVRLRLATAMAYAEERDAVPVLIELLPHVSLVQAWQAESILYRLAEDINPPAISLGKDAASREKCRAAWAAWWKVNNKKVDIASLNRSPKLLGYTLIVLLDLGRIAELGRDNETLWQMEGLVLPLDVQMLANKQVLVAEYHASRVTQRTLDGTVVWTHEIGAPLVAQRLANGNTFIVTDAQVLEVDRGGKTVFSFPAPGEGERIMKGMKLPNGEIACLTTDGRVVRMDTTGKVLHSFPIELSRALFGGRLDMMPNGRVLVPHNAENKVVEYDANGKVMWEVKVDQPIAATRLPNGNTIVTSMLTNIGAVEFDRNGNQVWQYRDNTRVTRAIKR